jgi:hypothetical protein
MKSHVKAQSRKEGRKVIEGFFALRASFASLRLCVRLIHTENSKDG